MRNRRRSSRRIEKDQWRSFALSGAPKATAADCAALAPLAAALPPSEQSALMHVVERWAVLDEAACEAYVKSLPPRTPAANMGVTSFAKVLAQRDPAAAAQLISGLPWNAWCYWQMCAVAQAWLKADPEAARQWLEAEPYVPGRNPQSPDQRSGRQSTNPARQDDNETRRDPHRSQCALPRRRRSQAAGLSGKTQSAPRLLRQSASPRPAPSPSRTGQPQWHAELPKLR